MLKQLRGLVASAEPEAFLSFISSSSEFGGAEGLMLTILDGLGPEVVRQVIFLGDGPVVTDVRRRGFDVTVGPHARRAGLLPAACFIRHVLREGGGKVVHANGVRAALVAVLATGATQRRVVWLKVDSSHDGWVARLIGRRCNRVVGISNSVNETFRGRARRRLRVVYPGIRPRSVDRPGAREAVRKILNCPPDSEVVVISARLAPEKGQLDLIEAAAHVLAERPGVRFAVLGGEHWPWEGYEAILRTRAEELGIAGDIAFLGHRPPGIDNVDDVINFVAGCNLLVSPSRYEPKSGWKEGFGYSPLEAMSVKVPVVAYRHGSFPEVLGDCAEFVEEGDSIGLARAVLRVLRDEEIARRMTDCGLQRSAVYDSKVTVEAMKAVYREAAGGLG